MTIAYWCVFIAAVLPYLFVGYAKLSWRFVKEKHNHAPRLYTDALEGGKKRAYWAQLNGFEAFPPFAAGVIIAAQVGVDSALVNNIAMAFVGLRLAHGVLYVLDVPALRSVAWAGGVACVVGLFAAAGRV